MREFTLPPKKPFISASELSSLGLSHYYIQKLINQGKLVKLNNSYYENLEFSGDISDFSYISVYAPKSVVCLMSAARFYNLTNFLPDSIDLAIDRDMKISTLPVWPQFHIVYYSTIRYETGVTTATDGTAEFKIYDIEKTVADILYYRNKVGIEETKEVLKNYLSLTERNLSKLHRYAAKLGCGKILSTYMEVLL